MVHSRRRNSRIWTQKRRIAFKKFFRNYKIRAFSDIFYPRVPVLVSPCPVPCLNRHLHLWEVLAALRDVVNLNIGHKSATRETIRMQSIKPPHYDFTIFLRLYSGHFVTGKILTGFLDILCVPDANPEPQLLFRPCLGAEIEQADCQSLREAPIKRFLIQKIQNRYGSIPAPNLHFAPNSSEKQLPTL